ncbi:hypothetical protein QFC20_003584 [Naganishia adeliensis]|uniref:Uncharacterized protein n=1 Tax=Naganishia adeliensis TaxID=92952 RepID=A0ACC2WA93_9TREE|nr:hypothetical protein QFC20_003584 [Naganishia adeliensis]
MSGDTQRDDYVNQQIQELGGPMFFTGPAGGVPVNLKTMNSEVPDHPLLRAYGELFMMAATPRNIMIPGWEVVSSLAGYKRHAHRHEDVRLAGGTDVQLRDKAQKLWANLIWDKMGVLRQLARSAVEEKEVRKFELLGRGLAQVFGTYFGGIEAYDGEVSPEGKRLVLKLAATPPIPLWKRVFVRAMEGKTYGQSHSSYCFDFGSREGVPAYSNSLDSGVLDSSISKEIQTGNVTDVPGGKTFGSSAHTGNVSTTANEPAESVVPDATKSSIATEPTPSVAPSGP